MILHHRDERVGQVRDLMRRRKIALEDLTSIGGAESKNPPENYRAVEKIWALMARLGVKHADLET